MVFLHYFSIHAVFRDIIRLQGILILLALTVDLKLNHGFHFHAYIMLKQYWGVRFRGFPLILGVFISISGLYNGFVLGVGTRNPLINTPVHACARLNKPDQCTVIPL